MKTVVIIQARMCSTRLPGKVLKDLCGQSVLARVVNRSRRAKLPNEVVVATSVRPEDDAVVHECERLGVGCFRGDEIDVLDRYYRAAQKHNADAVVRITADCPLIDPGLIDEHVRRLLDRWREVDFVTNMIKPTFPLGLAVEVMPADVLWRMKRMSHTDELKEHVTTMVYVKPDLFLVDHVLFSRDLSHLRWTVDTKEDLDLVRIIFQQFKGDDFAWTDVLPLLEINPEWSKINQHIRQKTVG